MKRKYIAKKLSIVMTAAMIMAATAVPAGATSVESAQEEQQTESQQPAQNTAPAQNTTPSESDSKPADSSEAPKTETKTESETPASETPKTEGSDAGSGQIETSQTENADTGTGNTGSSAAGDSNTGSSAAGTSAQVSSAAGASDTGSSAASASTDSTSSTESPAAQDTSAAENAADSASSSKPAQEKEKEPEESKEIEEADKHTGTNEQLIAQQNIQDVDVPEFNTDFRFYAADSKDTQTLAARDEATVYEETNTDSEKVGTLRKCASATKLKDVKDGWIYIESGKVRGFAKSEWFYQGDEAAAKQKEFENGYINSKEDEAEQGVVSENAPVDTVHPLTGLDTRQFFAKKIDEARQQASEEAQKYLDDSRYGTPLVDPADNGAYTYTRTTAQDHVTDKVPAFAKDSTAIYEEKSDSSTKAGTLDKDALAYVIESDGDWTYVESADVRGFVPTSALTTGDEAKNTFNSKKESDFATAKQLVKPSENKATYYSIVSVKEGTKTSSVREAMVKMALSCAGHPYVWGGTSLTNGADCSGFVQTIYKSFGINLPRVADAQSRVGTQIKVSDAAPGDLIFFARNGYVYHVAMYAGDGKTIEAYSSKAGIGVHGLSGRPAVWACRILKD